MPLGSRLQTVTSELSSNLLRSANFTLYSGYGHFCANLLNLSKFRCRVKPRFGGNQDRNSSSTAGRFSCLFDRHSGGQLPAAEGRTAQKFQTTTSDNSLRAFRAHKRTRLLGHAMVFVLCGIPYRGRERLSLLIQPYELASHFPLGAGHTATGRLHCSSATF